MITQKRHSYFKNRERDFEFLLNWVGKLEKLNGRSYERLEVNTSLGTTCVWRIAPKKPNPKTLVIFPGFRTTSLFWDIDRGLDQLGENIDIYLVETNGQPNLSDGNTPDIKSNGYGEWSAELFSALGINDAFIAGASFGGLVCMKLASFAPNLVNAIFLLNPGCLQFISLSPRTLYYNLLPILFPKSQNIRVFLDELVFCKPNHKVSEGGEQMIVDYERFAIRRYKDKTQKPYGMGLELSTVNTDTYLILGKQDLLFPYKRSVNAANKYIPSLRETKIFDKVGHGIETYLPALSYIGSTIRDNY